MAPCTESSPAPRAPSTPPQRHDPEPRGARPRRRDGRRARRAGASRSSPGRVRTSPPSGAPEAATPGGRRRGGAGRHALLQQPDRARALRSFTSASPMRSAHHHLQHPRRSSWTCARDHGRARAAAPDRRGQGRDRDLSAPPTAYTCGNDFVRLRARTRRLGFNADGGLGCISVTAIVAPRLCSEFQEATLVGLRRALDSSTRSCRSTSRLPRPTLPAKYGLSFLGRCADEVRSPLVPVEKPSRQTIRRGDWARRAHRD